MFRGLFILVILVVVKLQSFAQLSPGELAKAHAHLEGMSNCTQCHVLGEKVSNNKCLDCHSLLKKRIELGKGYHVSSDVKGKTCVECHNDHHGRNFEMIRFDKDTFKHDLTGYALVGAHQKLDCKACHQTQFISDKEISKKEYTYLGLGTSCLSCHQDYHQESLSSDCLSCHDMDRFAPASKFQHAKTKFPLEGKHQKVACDKCHKLEIVKGEKFQHFKGLEFNNCKSCHTDVHKNKFGNKCSECHSVNSFRSLIALNSFDHNRSNFKLVGKHKQVDCKACHTGSYTTPIAHKRCSNCHQDIHEGQFTKNNQSPDCKHCHTQEGFESSTFSIADHNKSKFVLEGAHLATACFFCHKKEDKWQFRNIGESCVDCHKNIHKGFIRERFFPKENCENCHVVSSWSDVQFDHQQTSFNLLGAHSLQTCRACHFKEDEEAQITQQFTGLEDDCLSCHQDEHHKQFEQDGKTDCLRCHSFNNWQASKFNHDNSQFKLEGEHLNVQCDACHKIVEENHIEYKQYKLKDFQCATCHQ